MSKRDPYTPLYPRHHSVGPGYVLRPLNMERIKATPEQREMLERNALGIFTDCVNANMTFRDALTAVLVSGMDWGVQASKEKINRS